MSDQITTYEDCPKCKAKGVFECYEQLGANLKVDCCTECGYTLNYSFEEIDGVVHISRVTPPSEEELREQ